jgi:hypothetical protein
MHKYAWQDASCDSDENDRLPKTMEEEPFENMKPSKKYR